MQSICIIYCTSNWYIFSCSSLICHGFTKLPSYNVSMLVLSQLGFSSQKYMVIFNLRDPSHEHILLFFYLSSLSLSLSLCLSTHFILLSKRTTFCFSANRIKYILYHMLNYNSKFEKEALVNTCKNFFLDVLRIIPMVL